MIKNFNDLKKRIPDINIELKSVIEKYGIHIPDFYESLIDFSNPNDPLFNAIVPNIKELDIKEDEVDDPIGDNSTDFSTLKTNMLIHRYPDRVLMLTTNKCAGQCRYCFRKSKVFNSKEIFNNDDFEKSLEYIKNTKTIKEVILSGGDPLCMPRDKFYFIFNFILKECPHIKGIRIHSRAPVYTPSIITDELSSFLNEINKKITLIFMTHIIHKKEINDEFKKAISKLNCVKINQSVLLKGINDTVKDLEELSWALIGAGILPHYLHYLDKAKGISHFKVSINKARNLVSQLHGHLSGHLIPKLILDTPQAMGKIILNKSFIIKEENYKDKQTLTIQSTHSDKIIEYKE